MFIILIKGELINLQYHNINYIRLYAKKLLNVVWQRESNS